MDVSNISVLVRAASIGFGGAASGSGVNRR